MRWNCPHCGIALAVSDDKLGAGWSFSKCYKCAGFALVRRSDVNLIKIDQAPTDGRVVLPETSEIPQQQIPLMSREATERLKQYGLAQPQQIGMTAAPASTDAPPIAQKQQQQLQPRQAQQPIQAQIPAQGQTQIQGDKPVIRPSIRRRAARAQAPAPAMGIGATAAGPAKPAYKIPAPRPLIEARGVNILQHQQIQVPTTPTAIQEIAAQLPQPLPDEPQISILRRLMPVAIAASALFVVCSGIYLYIQAQRIWDQARATPQVAEPVAAEQPQPEAVAAPIAPQPPQPQAQTTTTTDQVHQNAMAPHREAPPPSALVVRARAANVKLRQGPGLQYTVLGTADPAMHYLVQEWKADWFKVLLPGDESAWVRNDLVSLITVD
jgi:hypothetical protein